MPLLLKSIVLALLLSFVTAIGVSLQEGSKNGLTSEGLAQAQGGAPTDSSNTPGQERDLAAIDSAIDGKWQQFRHWSTGSQGVVCGAACIAGLNSEYAPFTPWEFELPAGGGCIMVVDGFDASDQFNVTDFENITIGTTSEPTGTQRCGKDPDYCYSLEGVSKGSFYLEEGQHSIKIYVNHGSAGSAFFRVTTDTSTCLDGKIETEPPTETKLTKPGANQAPVAKCKSAITISAKSRCASRVHIDAGSFDPDENDTITLTQRPASPYPVGTRKVKLTVTDSSGATSTCVTRVTVIDNEEIDQDSIDCGISDWHVQPCDLPVTYNASYLMGATLNTKKNGCPVSVSVSPDASTVMCERCLGDGRYRVFSFQCPTDVTFSGNEVSLLKSKTPSTFMTWTITAGDEAGNSVSKQCGVCFERPSADGCVDGRTRNLRNRIESSQEDGFKCPLDVPTNLDGSMSWPTSTLMEMESCDAIMGD